MIEPNNDNNRQDSVRLCGSGQSSQTGSSSQGRTMLKWVCEFYINITKDSIKNLLYGLHRNLHCERGSSTVPFERTLYSFLTSRGGPGASLSSHKALLSGRCFYGTWFLGDLSRINIGLKRDGRSESLESRALNCFNTQEGGKTERG